jgi:hypothetical protein
MTAPPSAGCGEIEDEIVPPQSPLPTQPEMTANPSWAGLPQPPPPHIQYIFIIHMWRPPPPSFLIVYIYMYTQIHRLSSPPIPKQVLTTIKEIHCQGLQAINGKTTHGLCESEWGEEVLGRKALKLLSDI